MLSRVSSFVARLSLYLKQSRIGRSRRGYYIAGSTLTGVSMDDRYVGIERDLAHVKSALQTLSESRDEFPLGTSIRALIGRLGLNRFASWPIDITTEISEIAPMLCSSNFRGCSIGLRGIVTLMWVRFSLRERPSQRKDSRLKVRGICTKQCIARNRDFR